MIRALRIAEMLFASIRVGRAGTTFASIEVARNRLEVIDVSKVATGFSRHSPHIESPEVIRDIHDMLDGASAPSRFSVRKAALEGYWEMIPS
jgi:hypothetical protein